MGIYLESNIGDHAVIKFVTYMQELVVQSIEYWHGYPLKIVGGKLISVVAPFTLTAQRFGSAPEGDVVTLIKGKVKDFHLRFTFYVNGGQIMKDKVQYSFEFDDDFEITEKLWIWKKNFAKKLHTNLNASKTVIGFSDDCIDPRLETPLYSIE